MMEASPDSALYLLAVLALILCSGFFSGSETGLTAVSKAKMHSLKKKGSRRAKLVLKLHEKKDRLIGTILLGNNAVNILASAIATSLAIHWFGPEGVFYVTIVMTLLVLVFAEVMPKTIAFYRSEQVSLIVAPVLMLLTKCFFPITWAVERIVDALLRMFGHDKSLHDSMTSLDELRGTIDLHHSEGKVIKRERDMLGSILDLSETEVHEVMIHRKNMESINIDLGAEKIVNAVLRSSHTRIPIWQDKPDNIVGIIHAKSLLRVLKAEKNIANLDIPSLLAEPWFIPETTTLNDQLSRFRQKRHHMAMVVDEYGDLVGLITLEDILEEIVGHIYDEYDEAKQGIKRTKSGIVVDGELTVRDLNRAMDWDLPDDYAATIAGLVIYCAEAIPQVGQEFEFYGYRFKIVKRKRNQITSLAINRLRSNATDDE